jgi:hypothetical protein
MSVEYFPTIGISFDDLFDGRLKRFGITTNVETGALIASDGTPTIVGRTDKGHAQFPDQMPVVTRNAIAAEFYANLSYREEATHVVVEGPSCVDAGFIARWCNAALECDRLLQQHFVDDPEFRKKSDLLEIACFIKFGPAAAGLIRKWLKDRHSFHLNLSTTHWLEIFTVMVGIGFFTRTGNHYQMTEPTLDLNRITDSLLQFAETEDAEYYPHPERHLISMKGYQAKGLRESLANRAEATRLADREKLLADRQAKKPEEARCCS